MTCQSQWRLYKIAHNPLRDRFATLCVACDRRTIGQSGAIEARARNIGCGCFCIPHPNARRAGGGEANAAAATGKAAAANAAGSGHGGQAPGGRQGGRRLGDEARGDKGVHGFLKRGTTCIFDARVTNTTCPTYQGKKVMQVLAMHEKAKKDKYLEACLERRHHFTPLVYSVQGVPGEETRAAEKRLAGHLAHRWKREYSEMCGYVRARMSLATARANTLLLRGARDSHGRQEHRPVFEDGAGVSCMENWRG